MSLDVSGKLGEAHNSPVLYKALIELPEALRNEFIAQIVHDWSRGLITPRPEVLNGASEDYRTIGSMPAAATAPSAAPAEKVASPAADRPSATKGRPDGAPTAMASQRANRLVKTEQRRDDEGEPHNPEAQFFQSMGDVGDAFDYINPRS